MKRAPIAWAALAALLVASRLCHVPVLWAEETLPLAAAGEMHAGKTLYRDIWFDKPPAIALLAWAVGGRDGIPLRIAGALYALLCCWLAFAFARDLWDERAGIGAASLLGFFLVFDFPAAVIPLASDLLMLAPHLAAVWMAYTRRPMWAGVLAGVALWVSPKGALVLIVCLLWGRPELVLAGFLAITAMGAGLLAQAGALSAYWQQVWQWGRVYASGTFVEAPLTNGLVRTLNWAGFHAALVISAAIALRKADRRWLIWLAISAASVAAGLRFFPRYYLVLLPILVLFAAHALTQVTRRTWYLLLLLLAVPVVRFTPTYIQTARGGWRDTAMDSESRAVAAILKQHARGADTLFVWGYRPEIYVYSGLHAATRYLDSQPLTGVPADRHLTQSTPVETVAAKQRRAELAASRPQWIVDGLGGYNPRLAITAYPDLQDWLASYREVARSGATLIYAKR